MDDFLTLIVTIFVVVSLYWQYHTYTNTNSLLYRIKQLEEKLTEQQAKLLKFLNKNSSANESAEIDDNKNEIGDLSCEIKREPKSTPSSYQPKTSTFINKTEEIQNKVENKEPPVYQQAQVSRETTFDKVSPKEQPPIADTSISKALNVEDPHTNKSTFSKQEPKPYQPKISTSRFAHRYQNEPKNTPNEISPTPLPENSVNVARANQSGAQTDNLGTTIAQARPASQYRPALNPRPKRQQKSILGLIWNWVVTGNPLA